MANRRIVIGKANQIATSAPAPAPTEPAAAAPPAALAPTTPSKSDLIRSFSMDVPPRVVVEKAKAMGIELTTNHVSAVRSRMHRTTTNAPGRPPGVRGATPAAKQAPKGATSGGAKRVSKTEFVLSLPANLPASEVVRQARAAGLAISTKYVYVIRSNAKVKRGPARKPGRPKGSSTKVAPIAAPPVRAASPESTFKKLVVTLGVESAQRLVEEVREKLEALFR